MSDYLPFKSFLLHLAQEVIRADAEMQLLQRRAWLDLNQGFPLMEGLDHLSYLGLREVRMTFWLEAIAPSRWGRLKERVLIFFGKGGALSRRLYRFGSGPKEGGEGFGVTVTLGRDKTGRVAARSEPAADSLQDVYVADQVA